MDKKAVKALRKGDSDDPLRTPKEKKGSFQRKSAPRQRPTDKPGDSSTSGSAGTFHWDARSPRDTDKKDRRKSDKKPDKDKQGDRKSGEARSWTPLHLPGTLINKIGGIFKEEKDDRDPLSARQSFDLTRSPRVSVDLPSSPGSRELPHIEITGYSYKHTEVQDAQSIGRLYDIFRADPKKKNEKSSGRIPVQKQSDANNRSKQRIKSGTVAPVQLYLSNLINLPEGAGYGYGGIDFVFDSTITTKLDTSKFPSIGHYPATTDHDFATTPVTGGSYLNQNQPSGNVGTASGSKDKLIPVKSSLAHKPSPSPRRHKAESPRKGHASEPLK